MKKLALTLSILFFSFRLAADCLAATTLIHATFDDGPLTPTSPAAGVFPITQPSSFTFGSTATATTRVFSSTESPWEEFGDGQALVLKKTGTDASMYASFTVNPLDKVSSGFTAISFDLMIDNLTSPAPTGNVFFNLINSETKIISSLILTPGGSLRLQGYAAGTGSATTSTGTYTAATLLRATEYNIKVIADFNTGNAQLYVNNEAIGTAQSFAASSYGLTGLSFSAASATVGQWAMDNVVFSTIPEPGTNLLLGITAVSVGALSRYLRKR